MGATVISERSGVGGSADPASSTLLVYGGVHTYYAIAPFAATPRDLNPAAWQCLAYRKNTAGLIAPTHTSVIFRRVKQVGDLNPHVGSFIFDISNVGLGEVMYVIADGDGNVANPWGVAIAFFVVRSNEGNQPINGAVIQGIATNIIAAPGGSNVWDGGPEIISWNDLSVQASGSGAGANYGPGTPGVDPNPNLLSLLDWSAFCFTAGTAPLAHFTKDWWVPDGRGSNTLAWPNDGLTWGMPLITSAGTEVDARMFTFNLQDPGATIPPPGIIVDHGVTDIFMMQFLAQGFGQQGDLGPLRLSRPPHGTANIDQPYNYGKPDILARRVRPQFIDQAAEGGGGIFFEH